jgi:NADPH:quinone reductase-like Zn-dependent oxidoreductase
MKAVVVHRYGGPDVLKFEDYPDPVPGPGEVKQRGAAKAQTDAEKGSAGKILLVA